jgi:hypothetical protein
VALAVLALGPTLFSRGYVLVGDMTFVPHQPWKESWLGMDGSVPRAVPADAITSLLSQVVPGDLLQKAILLGLLALAGLGVLRVTGRLGQTSWPARLGGAVLYVWNPYVFERLAIGHWGLLVGYAALPWVLGTALDVRKGVERATARLLLLLLVAAVGSPTGGLIAGLLAVTIVVGRGRVRASAVVLGSVLAVNLPWIAPALLNTSGTSDSAGVSAFAARADTPLGAWGSLLTLGGIWKSAVVPAERDDLLLTIATLVLVALSLAALGRAARAERRGAPVVVVRIAVGGAAGLLLAGLPATGAGAELVTHLVDSVPGAGMWRDSQKWLMPFVLAVAVGFVLALEGIGRILRTRNLPASGPVIMLALLPVVVLPSFAWGLAGRLVPVDYPTEWGTVSRVLEGQPADDRRTAVLPWSAYQRLPWNGNRAALDPASRFFPGQVVTIEDLLIGGGVNVEGDDPSSAAVNLAINRGDPLGPALARAGVRYLLVERTAASAVDVPLPRATVLHHGPQLLLLDLGSPGHLTRSPHRLVIVLADALTVASALGAGALLIRRRSADGSGTMKSGEISTAT